MLYKIVPWRFMEAMTWHSLKTTIFTSWTPQICGRVEFLVFSTDSYSKSFPLHFTVVPDTEDQKITFFGATRSKNFSTQLSWKNFL